jgi:NADPH:quinone reductase-like Zn-dependent oxidoreductase
MVQLAKHRGAEVTGVTSTNNLALVRSLGADRVIDYTKDDFTSRRETYDIVVDTVGKMPFARCKPMLKDKGRLLAVAAGIPEMLATLWAPLTGSRRVIAGPAEERASDVPEMAALAEAGALKPVIDRRYRFAQMAEAHAYVETGRKRGSVVVSVEPPR